MKQIWTCFFVLFFLSGVIFSQPVAALPDPAIKKAKPISADCKTAINLKIDNRLFYGVSAAPSGFGSMQEIKHPDKHLFEEEHNSAWYLLTLGRDGELVFEISPEDSTNDYDFLLYKWTDTNFCRDFNSGKLKPIRSNLSNTKKSVKGITGLEKTKTRAAITSTGKGAGNPYSSSVLVKTNEKYMLILDNVTPKGKGHSLEFNFLKEVEIKGTILDSDNKPVIADITISDLNGNTVSETKSDATGAYDIKTVLKENLNYNMTAISDSTFIQVATINTRSLKKDSVFTDIKLVLPKLKKGNRYKLRSINFYGNEARLVSQSFPSVHALCKLMKKNKKMIIEIEGHTNGAVTIDGQYELLLSRKRAQTIYDILVSEGIDKSRLSTIYWIRL